MGWRRFTSASLDVAVIKLYSGGANALPLFCAYGDKTMDEETTSHVWWYRGGRDATPTQHEFGMAITKADATNRILKMAGLKELPKDAAVSTRKLEKLEPKTEAQPKADEKA